MFELRLIYQGSLPSSSDSRVKHQIRRYMHKQLVTAWNTRYPLKTRLNPSAVDTSGRELTISMIGQLASKYQMGGKRFIPIVTEELSLVCSLDILMLHRDLKGIYESGDLDNRIKTLLDALRMPHIGEKCDGDEDPLFCLLEDDKLVSELKVTADLLFADPEQIVHSPRVNLAGEQTVKENHVCAIIHAKVKPTRMTIGNMEFM